MLPSDAHDDTLIAHAGSRPAEQRGAVNPPVYHASTVLFPTVAGYEEELRRADDPGHALWRRDFRGSTGLFSIVLKPCRPEALAAMLDGMSYFGMGVSWGGFESLILPIDPAPMRTATRWTAEGPLVRIHAGLEDPADLIADLDAGFDRLNAANRR